MSRRVRLPSADELFHQTPGRDGQQPAEPPRTTSTAAPDEAAAIRRGSGRVRHDEKITVYVTADELLDLDQTRLTLRREHGLAVDRGRIVREAIHLALAGVEADGADSALVHRLSER